MTRFREMRILKRILVTPLRPSRFITGQIGARIMLALAQVTLMLVLGVVLGATVRGDWIVILGLAAVGNLIFLGLGFGIAGLTKTVDGAQNLAALLTFPLMFLTGLFFPLESMPDAIQTVVAWLPMTPLVDAMRSVTLEGAGFLDLGPQLAVLGLWVAIAFAFARGTFRFSA